MWERGRGPARPEPPAADGATEWINKTVPEGWFSEITTTIDRDEILIVGTLPGAGEGDTDVARAAAERGRIAAFRAETRERRIQIAQQLEHRYRRKVSWGAVCGGTRAMFTTFSAPVMTRLRQPERQVLDTLVDAGVARSRSEALAWCVRLVGEHTQEWLTQLRDAMSAVDELRRRGPAIS